MTAPDDLPPHRRDYTTGRLEEADVDRDRPLATVRAWVDAAVVAEVAEPLAMTLATVDTAGVPDARVVLLRGIDDRGVTWFSNRASAKGQQLAERPVAAAVLYWAELERQVRLRGRVTALAEEASDRYWQRRPRAAQLAAVASDQSRPVPDRATLETRVAEVAARYPEGTPVPRPAHWGGDRLRPDSVELWQGRPGRLHDRLRLLRTVDGWRLERLMP